jgi:murein DD-endopeptidase MepM/ murein hydrolase activator NlpD
MTRRTNVSVTPRERPRLPTLAAPGVFPLPRSLDGRAPTISDGFHSKADLAAGKAKRQHRGSDWMYRRAKPGKFTHPWQSKAFEIPSDVQTPALAIWRGRVLVAGLIRTGGVVFLDHGGGLATAYHHLRGLLVGNRQVISRSPYYEVGQIEYMGKPELDVGDEVPAGYPVGIVGGSPVGYGLVHLHLDVATDVDIKNSTLERGRLAGRFQAMPSTRGWRLLDFEAAWGDQGRVGTP